MSQLSRVGTQLLVATNKMKVPMIGQHQLFSTTSAVGRGGSVSAKGEVHPGYLKIREQYKRFQRDDGVPIHLKAGLRDKALYYFTLTLTAFGLFETFRYYYSIAYPPKVQ